MKFCIHCVYCTRIEPDAALWFYECGNPEYADVSLIDGAKTFLPCAMAREFSSKCGAEGTGYLPMVPEFTREEVPEFTHEEVGSKPIWRTWWLKIRG